MHHRLLLTLCLWLAACSGNDKPMSEGTVDTLSDPPVVWLATPMDGDLFSPDATVRFEATITDDVTTPSELVITLSSSLTGEISHTASIDADGLFVADVFLGSGEQTITLSATDDDEQTGFDEVELVVNGAPGAPSVTIDPELPAEGASLSAVISVPAVDPDGDAVGYTWEWSVQVGDDESSVPYVPPDDPMVVPTGLTQRGQLWTATATPEDSHGNVGDSASATVMVGNSSPSFASATLSPNPAFTDDDLTVYTSGWLDADDDPEEYTYAWTLNGAVVVDVDGPILSSSVHEKGDEVTVTVTPVDIFSTGEPIVAEPVIISNSPPAVLSVSLFPSAPSTTEDISITVVGWSDADGDLEGYSYRWFVDGTLIAGATSDVLSADLTAHFQEFMVEVTPNDGGMDGVPVMSESVIVGNTGPAITEVQLSPNPAMTADAIAATPMGWSDLDDDAASFSYAWTIDGASVGIDASVLSPSLTQRGDSVQCTVTPSDGVDAGTPVTSAALSIGNSLPSVGAAFIDPAEPVFGDTLSCSWTTFVDADADADLSTVEWFIDGASAGTGTTLSGGFHGGQDVSCVVTPNDGIGTGSPAATTVTIGNTAPSLVGVTISPAAATASSTLTCSWDGFSDVDGDLDASTLTWEVNGSIVSTDPTLSGGFSRSDVVRCTVVPHDGMMAGTPVSTEISIANTAPSIDAVTISPSSGDWSATFTCAWSGYSDDDGDPDNTRVQWLNGDGIVLGTGTTHTGGISGGESIRCEATPNDGLDDGVPLSSAAVVIDNAPPSLDGSALHPLEPTVSSTLTCSPGTATDPDGTTSFSYTYRWEVGGVPSPGETSASLSSPAFTRGQSIQCFITVHDAVVAGDEVSSNIVMVRNSPPVAYDLSIGPSLVRTNDTVTASVSLSDADGDAVSALYAWSVNGVPVTGLSELAFVLNGVDHFDKDDAVSVTVTPSELTETGVPISSGSITILNTAPGAPTLEISPGFPQPEDDLYCSVSVAAHDDDLDTISYDYQWYRDGSASGYTTATIPASATSHGEHWECEATAHDGDVAGGSSSHSVVINDSTNPDPPQFDDLAQHTNSTSQGLTGDCEARCLVEIDCLGSLGTDNVVTTCSDIGRFSTSVSILRGDIFSCVATCTDEAGNASGPGAAHSIESCNPYDTYEDASDYGDHPGDVVDEWATLSDDGSLPIQIRGNVLDDDDDDWFVVSASDGLAADLSAGVDYFNFNVELTEGVSDYRFVVHRGGSGSGDLECPSIEGYSEYNWFAQDNADGTHLAPTDTRSCRSTDTPDYNNCEDNSSSFYIHVYRLGSSLVNCDHYQLTITNGVWE